ncbi:Uncharacterised protein [Chryseobacterium carnipullorum]|uniref:Uncharacterized protein n=1 Tax=Chryseobacterium carnipullorum TaxID=1124835 RepID=A0A376ECR1_CHRCU|nr:Uncharacterised protein [Chryseobacterium carnipullorum]
MKKSEYMTGDFDPKDVWLDILILFSIMKKMR